MIFSFFRVTRTLFAFAELTNTDPDYAGPEFDFDKIIKELMMKVLNMFVNTALTMDYCCRAYAGNPPYKTPAIFRQISTPSLPT